MTDARENYRKTVGLNERLKVSFEYFPVMDDDPNPFRAHIVCDRSDHHGIGRSPAEALFRAAQHWLAYTNLPRDWQSPNWTDSGWHRHVAQVIQGSWPMLTDDQKRAIASACAKKDIDQ